ncbi:deoxycytidylate deaminase [Plakobranchus ocellatus]|uniref:dCMP deaminase n=1 Tax=Plakobranchus ocellatus TaxID=259542 RepID=A0AAV4AZR3_9GAST|nr:deoxycytidylate deaminase [Plakobranchus ocellatus]
MANKRKNYLEWQEYFMSIAFLSAQRSKDPSTQVGACIVNKENKVVGIGYNGMPIGCSDDVMPWNKVADTASKESWLRSKLPYECHAELNAVLNKNCADVKDCIIYVALFPCNLCAQIIIQSGISEVVYYSDRFPERSESKAAKHLLDMAGVSYRRLVPKQSQVEINFGVIDGVTKTTPIPFSDELSCTPSQPLENTSCNLECHSDEKEHNLSASARKRSNYLEWEEYFMAMAFLSAQRSKDPRTQVGACIVNGEKKIVGIGYNGMPIGCSDDVMPWNRAADTSDESWLESKSPYVCHAELNAVLNKNSADIKGCTIYVALFPCNKCAQVVIQSGIKEVVYYSDKYHHKPEFEASRHMLSTAGVKYRHFRPRQETIIIDFGPSDTNKQIDLHCVKGQADSSTEKDREIVGTSNKTSYGDIASNDQRVLNGTCVRLCASTSYNNIGKSRNLNNHLDTAEQINTNIVAVNDHDFQASLQFGWLSELQELSFTVFSFLVAGLAVLLSSHAGTYDLFDSIFFYKL